MSAAEAANQSGLAASSTTEDTVYRLPSSPSQRRFWVWSHLNPQNPTFNVAVRWRLDGAIDRRLLERACNLLLSRHEALRTALICQGEEVLQEVRPTLSCPLEFIDLSSLTELDRAAAANEIALREAQKPFDISRAPLIRFTLLQLQADEFILLCTAHHAICDGASVGILAHDLGLIYDALARGEQPALLPPDLQYADYAIWLQENANSGRIAAQLNYWKATLAGAHYAELRTDYPRGGVRTSNGDIASRLLPRPVTDALAEFSRSHGCTLFAASLGCMGVLLSQLTDAEDLTIGTQVVGRQQAETERVVGVFTNTLCLRFRADRASTIQRYLAQVQQVVRNALENQDVPFDDVVRELNLPHDPVRTPLFQVHFIFQRSFVQNSKYESLSLTDMPSRTPGAGFDLNFFMVEREEGWRLSCEYNTDLFRRETVEWLLQESERLFSTLPLKAGNCLREMPVGPRPTFAKEFVSANHAGRKLDIVEKSAPSEELLVEIFREILKVPTLEPRDSFFDLGGHSLLAARLLSQIKNKCGREIPLSTLVEAPSPRELAKALGSKPHSFSDRVITLQSGTRDPLFVISQSLVFRNVAKALDPSRAVYALRMLPEDAAGLPSPCTMQAIASYYVRLIQQVQPTGPYRLAGWCVAAKIAYEVAQQLQRQGEVVELLALIDAWAPNYFREMNPLRKGITYLAYAAHRAAQHLRHALRNNGRHSRHRREQPTEIEKLEYAAEQTYLPVPYSGRAILFFSSEQPSGFLFEPRFGLDCYLSPQTAAHRLNGSHLSIFDPPNAVTIAAGIEAASASRLSSQK